MILSFEQTCTACPEQYDVYDDKGDMVAYVRLRHSVLTVECPDCGDDLVLKEHIKSGGAFSCQEDRDYYLFKANEAIINYYNKGDKL